MTKALLIGCGNIGAGYDLHDASRVWTHAKAYAQQESLELTVYDSDQERAARVASIYRVRLLPAWSDEVMKDFDIISITTPTPTHFDFLKKAIAYKTPVVICEKPVLSEIGQVEPLMQMYRQGETKILVNYIRRFQPGYREAKKRMAQQGGAGNVKGIIIKYKRGFLNNASHAIDLIQYLFDRPFAFQNFKSVAVAWDSFDYDPTITACCTYEGCPVSFAGVIDAAYGIFEIELFFTKSKIVICHSGNEIRFYEEKEGSLQENITLRQSNLLDTYMLPVIAEAHSLLFNQEGQDNFIGSLQLNQTMLEIIEPLKISRNATISH